MAKVGKGLFEHKSALIALLLLVLAMIFLGPALFPPEGEALGTHDTGGLFAPWFEAIRLSLSEGRVPWWDPYQFSGYPFLSNPQVAYFYPPMWLTVILPSNMAIGWHALIHVWLAAVGMLLFARKMGAGWLGSTAAALVYGFSGFFAARLWAGHIGLVATFAWLPWVILATRWCIGRADIWSAIVAGLPVGLAILAGHTPSFLYIAAMWLAFVLFFLFERSGQRRIVVRQALVMLLVGLGLAAVQLLPFVQLSLASQRLATSDFDFATGFSLPPAHLVTLLLPEFFGEPTRVGYWSVPTFEELTYYAGLIVVFGVVLAVRKKSRLGWFYILLMITGLWMALGSYSGLYRVAYAIVPVVRLLRAPARSAVVYVFAAAGLLAHALSGWQSLPAEERSVSIRPLAKGTLLVVALTGAAALAATGAVFMAIHPTDTSGRLWHQIGGYGVAIVVLLLGIGLIWGLLATQAGERRRRILLASGLLILIVVDLWQFGAKLVVLEDTGPDPMWSDAKALIGDSYDLVVPWGVSIFDQSGSMEVGLRSTFGYQALEPSAMVAFTSHVPDPRSSAYDVLGARFVVAPVELSQFAEGEGGLELVGQQGAAWVYRRPRALDVARLAYRVEIIEEDGQAIGRVHEPDFDARNTVILDGDPGCIVGLEEPAEGLVTVESMSPGFWRIATQSTAPGMLVLAESDFAGWEVTVDGEPSPASRAFTTVRAVCVPAGEHVVEWSYKPDIFLLGGLISILSLVLVGVALIMIKHAERDLREVDDSLTE